MCCLSAIAVLNSQDLKIKYTYKNGKKVRKEETNPRHALAVALNNLRHEFGYNAQKVAVHSKTVKAWREKVENHR